VSVIEQMNDDEQKALFAALVAFNEPKDASGSPN
jgi:hypothetical protein